MKNYTLLSVMAFCFLTFSFGVLILGVLLEGSQVWTNIFALSFSVGLLVFWGWVALTNKKS
jgi:hypothetical protein